MEPDPIIQALAAQRRDLGLLQRRVAELLHVRDNTVAAWESGATDPALWRLREWCRVLGMALWIEVGGDVVGGAS